ncbi:MAG: hypothetical protein AB1Z19_04660 [Eubacteriales bacterium]
MTETEKYLYRYYQLERLKALAKDELMSAVAEYDEKAEALLKPLNLSNTKVDKTNRINDPVQNAVVEMLDIYLKGIEKAKASHKQLIDEQDAIERTCERGG